MATSAACRAKPAPLQQSEGAIRRTQAEVYRIGNGNNIMTNHTLSLALIVKRLVQIVEELSVLESSLTSRSKLSMASIPKRPL